MQNIQVRSTVAVDDEVAITVPIRSADAEGSSGMVSDKSAVK